MHMTMSNQSNPYQPAQQTGTPVEVLLDRITDGIFAVDNDWRFVYLNETAHELINPQGKDLLGKSVWEEFPDARGTKFEKNYRRAMDEQVTISFEEYYPEPLNAWFRVTVYPSETGLSVYCRDVTEERRRKDEIKRSARTKHKLHEIAVSDLSLEEKIDKMLEIGTDRFGLEYGFLANVTLLDTPYPGECEFEVMSAYGFDAGDGWEYPLDETYCSAVVESDAVLWTTNAEESDWISPQIYDNFGFDTYIGGTVNMDGEPFGTVAFAGDKPRDRAFTEAEEAFVELICQWVSYELSTERYQHELEQRVQQQHAVAELGQQSIAVTTEDDLDELFHNASEAVADVLENAYCKVLDLDPEAQELLLRQGVGWQDGIVGNASVASNTNSQAGYTLLQEEPVIVDNLAEETRFRGPDLLTSHGVVSGISVIIGSLKNPWGILGTHDTEAREFTEYDADFVQTVANILGDTIDRVHREQRLEQQRDTLATINECYSIVRSIAHTIIDTNDRDTVEQEVCDRLISETLETDMAWIGDVSYGSDEISPTYVSSDEHDYLKKISIPLASEGDPMAGPAVKAIRTHQPQPVSDVTTDETVGPWRDAMLESGYQSAIGIPLVHNNFIYGLLAVYSSSPGTFDDEVADILGHLGQLIGHTIHAIEQERALRGDSSVVELEYRSTAVANPFRDADRSIRLEVDRTVHTGDRHLSFARVTGVDPDRFIESFSQLPTIQDVSLVRPDRNNDSSKESLFMIELAKDSIVDLVEQYGGRAKSLTVENGEMRLVVELPVSADISRFSEEVRSRPSTPELLSKRTTEREWITPDELSQIIETDLTPRQRDVLQTAHVAGYFDDPRAKSGKEVAEILGISGATFSQHLRIAERKLLDAIF